MGQADRKIYELIDKIDHEEIRLPEMQRNYVWRGTQVRDLLDSLYRGYPSGTILVWETDKNVATREFAVGNNTKNQHRFDLLLDGQQRLTSLYALLRGEPVNVKRRKKPIDLLFNLEHPETPEESTSVADDEETEDDADANADEDTDEDTGEDAADANQDEILERHSHMTFAVHTKLLAAMPHWVPVTKVFKESGEGAILRSIGITSTDDPRYDKYAERINRLRDIKNYAYRVYTLGREMSYKEVTDIFVRVNSKGTKLRSSDLALAQITANWRNSLKIFQNFEEECIKLGFDVKLSIILRNLMAVATDEARFNSAGSLSKEQLEEAWPKAQAGMRYALNFLKSNVGIESPALLSANFLIITLAYYGHVKGYSFSPEEEEKLRYWALLANVKGRYSRGSSETILNQDLAAVRKGGDVSSLLDALETQAGRLDIAPGELENKNSNSALFKTMLLAFRKEYARDWEDQLVISQKHAGARHSLQFHHIFPEGPLKKRGVPPQMINDICNMSFIGGGTNRKISDKEPALYLPDVDEEERRKQCIPADSALWTFDAYEDFLKQRRLLVTERLNQFLGGDKEN